MGEGFGYAVEQAAFKKGYEEQMIRSIISLTKTLDLSVKQAMDVLEIPEEQQEHYTELLKKSKGEKGCV